ncbi:MAG: TIGR03960 family B12-binding radical SAM protein [Planctomycetes bacterium]|nr:TIGR03960 family B12-binding radical SAM protein [Planctomycetota bacterium]
MSQSLAQRISHELLPRVRQPAQYIGGEVNQLVEPGDWQKADIRVAIAFPDTYTIGMSHLGCQILYWLCNHTPGVCAERVYCPWIDAEEVMRRRKIPLFTWDTRQPVGEADILAISLQYELCFTNVLNLLDLAGIPLRAADRTDDHPLVLAGGPQADNPEPMAEFLDLVVIGDGEHSLAAILDAYREYKANGVRRREMIALMARRFAWIYAPNLYEPSYHADGTLAGLLPQVEGIPTQIERCKTPDFDDAPFPMRPLVPWIEVVHDRISIEIMRGCPQLCRFCHAGYTKRPLHYRTPDRIMEIAEEAYWATGQDELGLLSLSTADYPHLRELAGKINERFGPRMVNLSFPSLRIDKMLQNIPWMANSVRKGGITMAVEAARDDMRRAIRKKVTDGNLMDGVREVYKAGWNRVKLYFMSGFPGERDDDILGIWELANAVSLERRVLDLPPARVVASVGWLVPKPFTPFQWMAQPRVEYYREVRQRLRDLQKGRKARRHESMAVGAGGSALNSEPRTPNPRRTPRGNVVVKMHDPQRSILEGVFSRGDRRLGPVVYEAWKRGARLDGWDETFDNRIWMDAYEATGVDPDFYAHRERSYDELLPWDHIGLRIGRAYLEKSYDDVFEQINVERGVAGAPLPAVDGRVTP